MIEHRTRRVLVVDDEADIRQLLIDALSQAGLEVAAAASGREAIEQARRQRVDFVVTDLCLGDCSGLDVLDQLAAGRDLPAVIITGRGDARSLSEASRRRPVELMTKPLDVERLRTTIGRELRRRSGDKWQRRAQRLRGLARDLRGRRRQADRRQDSTFAGLTQAYQQLCEQMEMQQSVLVYQQDLLSARTDDDVFRAMFRLFVRRSGGLFGAAMVCDAQAELQVIGRFGVPQPDGLNFCRTLAAPVIDEVLASPQCLRFDATDRPEMFDASIRPFLIGLNVLAIPLCPEPGELIGLALLYRKGEQPFEDGDAALAEAIATPTALAIRRND